MPTTPPARYEHTQLGRLHWILVPVGAVLLVAAAAPGSPAGVRVALALAGLVFLVLALAFRQLTVRERGDALELAFGPLPLFRREVPYAAIATFRAARSRWIDGWGIHWIPGRGWTWNLWGFDCVELETARGPLRVGTDDPEGLVEHLARRCRNPAG